MSVESLPQARTPARTLSARAALLALLKRLHFAIGLFVGPFIFVAALTGTLYVLTPQLENALYAQQLFTDATGPVQPLSRQVAAAQAAAGHGARIIAVRPAPSPGQTTRVMFAAAGLGPSESRALFIDPHTLALRGELTAYGTSGILPLRTTLDYLHRNLLLGEPGRVYSELAASWLWVAALGGLALWLMQRPPRLTRHATENARQQQRTRRRHTVTGLTLLLGLLFFSATGLTWSNWAGSNIDRMRSALDWMTPAVNTELHRSQGEKEEADPHAEHHGMMMMPGMVMPPAPAQAAATFDGVLAAARQAGIAADRLEIRPAKIAGRAWTVNEINPRWPTRVDSAAIDPHGYRVVDVVRFADFPLVAKLTRWGIDAHMGVLFGLPNQLVLAAFGLGLCLMILWGYRMWWLRRPAAPAQHPAQTLSAAWAGLPWLPRLAVVLVAAGLALALPVMGVSLLLFLSVDVWRWRRSQA
ncbi:PepSY-associated TM helix domain-containing protein [Chimaeribacter arupi]|uniref:PepSY-associated TM helix domain-containing protein n=1 Tax=Chimaeribacter arupi TaxID=2060066 RepID=UPI002945C109|nr:PepSY-associated TM helix domain-containing protein [Chimaeribacter arupi]MDV5139394.1 PepSY-associated TM helix domain-containing protein [Chimaeribacter arupi]